MRSIMNPIVDSRSGLMRDFFFRRMHDAGEATRGWVGGCKFPLCWVGGM